MEFAYRSKFLLDAFVCGPNCLQRETFVNGDIILPFGGCIVAKKKVS